MAKDQVCEFCGTHNPKEALECLACKGPLPGLPPPATAPSPPPPPTADKAPLRPPPAPKHKSEQRITDPRYYHGLAIFAAAIMIGFLIVLVSITAFYHAPEALTYTFKTGVNHPQAVRDLMKNDTVVLHISQNNCTPDDEIRPKIADLQSQYPNVTFAEFNMDNNLTSKNIGQTYGLTYTPALIVIRSDGATAFVTGTGPGPGPQYPDDNARINAYTNTIKSAIEDAQNWQQTHPTLNP